MLVPLIEVIFKGLFFDACKDRANAILESICREIQEDQFILAIEKEFISNQNLWMVANDWISNYKQQMMLETDNFGISQAKKFAHTLGRQSPQPEDRLVDYDEDQQGQVPANQDRSGSNYYTRDQESEGEDYFDRRIEAPINLQGLNDSDDWKIQHQPREDSFDQQRLSNKQKASGILHNQIKTENNYFLPS